MSVLSENKIRERLHKSIEDPKSLVITPLLNEKFDHDAVDLSLGCYFRSPAVSSIGCIKPFMDSEDHYPELVHKLYRPSKKSGPFQEIFCNQENFSDFTQCQAITDLLSRKEGKGILVALEQLREQFSTCMKDNNDGTYILQPHHSVLASTLEYIKMPSDVSGQILTKSSWARVFISIASAPWIHPFFRGCLTLEITNLGNVPVALPIGKPIAQLVLMKVDMKSQPKEDIIEGKYAGAVMPESPRFK